MEDESQFTQQYDIRKGSYIMAIMPISSFIKQQGAKKLDSGIYFIKKEYDGTPTKETCALIGVPLNMVMDFLDENGQFIRSIKEEEERLKKSGYEGDVKTKMFTSIKYYYMKKEKKDKKNKKGTNTQEEKTEKRKKYISLSHSMLETIDNHIMKEINHNMEKNGLINIEPSSAYLNFCKENQLQIIEEIKILKEQMDQNEIATKLKKTYKNIYQNKKTILLQKNQ